jgi:predicted outer membrane protein
MDRLTRSTHVAVVVSVLAAVACGGTPPPNAPARAQEPTIVVVTRVPTNDTPESPPLERRVPDVGSTNAQPRGESDLADLDDSELAGLVRVLLDGEIRAAQLAESRAATPDVKRFARETTTTCLDLQARQSAILLRLPIAPPRESAASEGVKNATQSELSFLQGLRGTSFDREYADGQVRDQQAALDLIQRVADRVKDPDLRAYVRDDVQAKVEVVLHMAQALHGKLEKVAPR